MTASKYSLAKLICVYFDTTKDTKDFSFIYLNSIKYLLRSISASEFHKRIKTVSKKSIKKFRLQITASGYCLLNLKLYVINAVAFRKSKGFNLKESYTQYGIRSWDRQCLDSVYRDKEIVACVKAYSKEFGGKKNLPCLKSVADTLAVVMSRISKKLYSTVFRKLRFIAKSGPLDLVDLRTELQAQLIQSYYWMIPQCKSEDHWVMTMLKTLKNLSVNLINYWTAKKRARMVRADNGDFIFLETSENIQADSNEDFKIESAEVSDSFRTDMELTITTKQLITKFATTEKKSMILKLMMGVFDVQFTEWLKKNKLISNSLDNTDYQEQASRKDFFRSLASYIRISESKMLMILEKLKYAISGNLNGSTANAEYEIAA